MRIISGGSDSRARPTWLAIRPIWVDRPVAVTTPLPRPWVTMLPAKQRSNRSDIGASSATAISAFLVTASDSPVSIDSSIARLWVEVSRRSAGTLSPE